MLNQGSILNISLGVSLNLLSRFTDVNVRCIRRTTNQGAHALAKALNVESSRMEWVSNPLTSN